MRLLMVSGDRQVAVGERGPFFALLREFSRHFERIDVLCPRPERAVSVTTLFERVHLHAADCSRSAMPRFIARTGAALLAEHGAQLIVSHDYGWFYNGIGAARLARTSGVPYVSEIHHVPGHPVAVDWRERFDKFIAKRYVRWARSRASKFRVVNSVEMPALLESWGVPREQIVVLPSLYIDLEVFAPQASSAPFEQDVCFVGRMVANKGLERIVDALARLPGAPTALFVGKGPLLESTKRRAAARGRRTRARGGAWVARPEALSEIYRRSRVVVCASSCEGGPRFTVEAMACGTPVVSTPVGMMNELVRDGVNGARCGFDTASLAQALERMLGDEPARRRMGAAAREDTLRFEYASVIRGYAEGLKRIAGVTP
jgi:glycosyltransferase involved in cell wall biosynthesis